MAKTIGLTFKKKTTTPRNTNAGQNKPPVSNANSGNTNNTKD